MRVSSSSSSPSASALCPCSCLLRHNVMCPVVCALCLRVLCAACCAMPCRADALLCVVLCCAVLCHADAHVLLHVPMKITVSLPSGTETVIFTRMFSNTRKWRFSLGFCALQYFDFHHGHTHNCKGHWGGQRRNAPAVDVGFASKQMKHRHVTVVTIINTTGQVVESNAPSFSRYEKGGVTSVEEGHDASGVWRGATLSRTRCQIW